MHKSMHSDTCFINFKTNDISLLQQKFGTVLTEGSVPIICEVKCVIIVHANATSCSGNCRSLFYSKSWRIVSAC